MHKPAPHDRSAEPESPRPERRNRCKYIPYRRILWTAVPIALTAFYMTQVAPTLIPVPADVRVPFPQATASLEKACEWCGNHPFEVLWISLALLIPVALSEVWPQRSHVWISIIVITGLSITYLSISAPIDRLISAVEAQIPADERVPAPDER